MKEKSKKRSRDHSQEHSQEKLKQNENRKRITKKRQARKAKKGANTLDANATNSILKSKLTIERRKIKNRESAQRSRENIKKLIADLRTTVQNLQQYKEGLETKVELLQSENERFKRKIQILQSQIRDLKDKRFQKQQLNPFLDFERVSASGKSGYSSFLTLSFFSICIFSCIHMQAAIETPGLQPYQRATPQFVARRALKQGYPRSYSTAQHNNQVQREPCSMTVPSEDIASIYYPEWRIRNSKLLLPVSNRKSYNRLMLRGLFKLIQHNHVHDRIRTRQVSLEGRREAARRLENSKSINSTSCDLVQKLH